MADSVARIRILGDSKDGQRAMKEYAQSVLEAEKSHDSFNKSMAGVGSTGLKTLGLLPIAGIAAGLGVAGGLAVIPLALAAVGIAALKTNQEVVNAFSDAGDTAKTVFTNAVQPLVPFMVQTASKLSGTMKSIGPDLQAMFADAVPGLNLFVDGVTGMVTNLMPGLRTAVRSSYSVFEGLADLMRSAGTGISEFFQNLSGGSKGAGILLTELGTIIQNLLSFAGSLLSRLSNAFDNNFGQVRQILAQVEEAILKVADGALPVLGTAVTGALNVVSTLIKVIEPFAGIIGTAGAAMLVAAGAAKALGLAWTGATTAASLFTAKGAIATGLSSVASSVENVALKGGMMAESLTSSSRAGMGLVSAGTAVSGVLSGIGAWLPVVGIGIAALGIAFAVTAQNAEELARKAEGNASNLIKGGLAADMTRKHLAALGDENVRLTSEQGRLEDQIKVSGTAAGTYAGKLDEVKGKLAMNADEIRKTKEEYEKQKAALTGSALAQVNYNEEVQKHGPLSAEATRAAGVWRSEIDKDAEAQRNAAAAIQTTNEKLLEQENQLLAAIGTEFGYNRAVEDLTAKQNALNETLKTHNATSAEAKAAMDALNQSSLTAISAAGAYAAANYKGSDSNVKAQITSAAMNAEALRQIDIFGAKAPPAVMQFVAQLDNASLSALGVQRTVNGAGETILRLHGKDVNIGVIDHATGPAMFIDGQVRSIKDKVVTITVVHRGDVYSSYDSTGRKVGMDFKAVGGYLRPNVPTVVGENGPELIFPSRADYVATAEESKKIASGAGRPMSVDTSVGAGSSGAVTIINTITIGDVITQAKDARQLVDEMFPAIEQKLLTKSRRNGRGIGIG